MTFSFEGIDDQNAPPVTFSFELTRRSHRLLLMASEIVRRNWPVIMSSHDERRASRLPCSRAAPGDRQPCPGAGRPGALPASQVGSDRERSASRVDPASTAGLAGGY